MQITGNQPAQYDPTRGINTVPQNTPAANASQNSGQSSGYPYGDDVFSGKFSSFKNIYSNFDSGISRFSPFYGKMGSSAPKQEIPVNQPNPANNQPGQNNTQPQVQSSLPPVQTQSPPPAPVFPKKEPPKGPVINNLQQLLQQEVQAIQTPQKAVEVVAQHAMISRQERTITNDIAWGARFYAKKAEDMASSLSQNKNSMNPGEVQKQLRTIEDYRIKSISMLNEAKKKAINTYNEALKANLIYNHFFTENGSYANVINQNDRQFVESEIDKTWERWTSGFAKNWQGQNVKADAAPSIVDKAAQEIAVSLDKVEKSLAVVLRN